MAGSSTQPPALTDADFARAQKGESLNKYMLGKRGKGHKRFFKLSKDRLRLQWKSKYIHFDAVDQIRMGHHTDVFKREGKVDPSDQRSFSVFHTLPNGEPRTLDLEAKDAATAARWFAVLNASWAHARALQEEAMINPMNKWLLDNWRIADKNKDGKLDVGEITVLLNQLNAGLSKGAIRKKFQEADTDKSGTFDFDEFKAFYRGLKHRPEVTAVFDRFCKGKKFGDEVVMVPAEMAEFFSKEQAQRMTVDQARMLMKKFAPGLKGVGVTVELFGDILSSLENAWLNPAHVPLYMDMKQPLPHYWIASSHNTYLEADQLRGKSSVQAYINAFKKGCKCVELDVWDGPDGEPIIYHGHTLTSKIAFIDVIKCVHDHAFMVSPYPCILSFENHCSKPQQVRMAEICKKELGDMLAKPLQDGEFLPSPDALKGKVLIKGKVGSAEAAAALAEEDSDDDEDDEVVGEVAPLAEEQKEAVETFKKEAKASKGKKEKIVPEITAIVYLRAVKHKGWDKPGKPWEMSSFSEAKALKYSKKKPNEFLKYNERQLARIYPAGLRVNSSNYSPELPWVAGCQIVALNYQTADTPMMLNFGRFSVNAGCGYVLRPKYQLTGAFDPNGTEATQGAVQSLTIRVICANQLPKPGGERKGEVIDPYVEVELAGVESDAKKFKTKTIMDNGFNPRWEETFAFSVRAPELDLIHFRVFDWDQVGSNDFVAHACIPVSSIRTGLRCVPLFSAEGILFEMASLTCHISLA